MEENLLGEKEEETPTTVGQFVEIRQRVIGTTLRIARLESKISYKKIKEETSLSPARIKGIESGEKPISLPELILLATVLNVPMEKLMAQSGKVGNWRKKILRSELFFQLPEDLQDFACQPVNTSYLELARKLSSLSADKLRAVAEGLLEITY